MSIRKRPDQEERIMRIPVTPLVWRKGHELAKLEGYTAFGGFLGSLLETAVEEYEQDRIEQDAVGEKEDLTD